MRFSQSVILTTGSMSGNVFSNGVDVRQDWAFSIQANYSGNIAAMGNGLGTLKLQVSNDNVAIAPSGPSGTNPAERVQNWCDYTGTLASTSSSAGSSTFMWIVSSPGFSWVRMAYVAASGSGIISANFSGKGA